MIGYVDILCHMIHIICSLTSVGKGSCQCVMIHCTVVFHSMPLFARTKQLHHLSMPVGKGFVAIHLHRQCVTKKGRGAKKREKGVSND